MMHPYLFELASLMAIFSLVIVAPGADLAMVIRQSLAFGRRQAVMTSFGIGAALMFHMTYTILGLGLLISQSILIFNIVKWCGVAYLIYIGIQSLLAGETRVDASADGTGEGRRQSAAKAFLLGFAANALNPKAVFFFLSIFSSVISLTTPTAVKFGYGLVMATALIAWFVGVSLFMTTPTMRAAFGRMSKWINRAGGLVFIGFGLKLATYRPSL